MYNLHSLHGQFSGCHFFFTFLKASNDVSFLNSLQTLFQIFGARNEILFVLQETLFKFGKLSCENCCKLALLLLN